MKISPNLKTIAVWGAGTFAALWIAENYLGLDISHHAAKKAAAPKAAKGAGGAKTAKGGGGAAAAAAPAADPTATGGAAPAASGFTCTTCNASTDPNFPGQFVCSGCTGGGTATAGGGGTWGQNPASKTPCDIPGQACPTVGALGGTSQWCKCIAGGSTTPAASTGAVAYAYRAWAIAR